MVACQLADHVLIIDLLVKKLNISKLVNTFWYQMLIKFAYFPF